MEIRLANRDELDIIMPLYEKARAFMRENGNPTQWGTTEPTRETVENDILLGRCHLVTEQEEIAGVFYFEHGKDVEPCYASIDGAWLNDAPYGVMHRVISTGKFPGVVEFASNWCLERCSNLRIDTHANNRPMQSALRRCGFHYCGIVIVEDGTERLAYQKIV